MDLVEVEIIGMVMTARYGTLNTGDILRTDADFAKHLVEDCAAAKYPAPRKAIVPTAPEAKKTQKKREKQPESAPVSPAVPTDLAATSTGVSDEPGPVPSASSEDQQSII